MLICSRVGGLVRLQLKYSVQLCGPNKHVYLLEGVQRRAMRTISVLQHFSYEHAEEDGFVQPGQEKALGRP